MNQICKRFLSSLLCLAMLLTLLPMGVLAEDAAMSIQMTASAADAQVGDVVEYTVTASGSGIVAMQFDLVIPDGMTYVPNSASVPTDLSRTISWIEVDWTEQFMRWTGYNAAPTDIAADTVILTFCCTVDAHGTYQVGMQELLVYDQDYQEVQASVTVDPVTGHTYADTVFNGDATCTQDGTKTATCSQCGAVVTVAAPGTALGHTFSQYTPNNDATCTEDGTKTATCDRCGVIDTAADEGSALGHAYTAEKKEPTCTEGGYTTYTCTVCGDSYVDEYVDIGDHAFGEYIFNNDATCTEDGTQTATCADCGITVTMAAVGTALGHTFSQYTPNNDATCTEDGTKTATCDRCGVIDTAADEGSALGHAYTAEKKEPTCTEGGYTTYTCTVCGDSYVDEYVDALGHAFGEYISNNDATCTEDGTKTATCDRCGVIDTAADEGSALGHAYTAEKKEPTCTEGGYTTYTCTVCGDSYVDEYADALGHAYRNGICTVCGVLNEKTYMNMKIVAEQISCEEVSYTVYGHGAGMTALQFGLLIPEGMTYVPNSAWIPEGLKDDLRWVATDWNEKYMRWSGYNDLPTDMAEDTVLLTFACTVDIPGTYEIGLYELEPFDECFEKFTAFLTVDPISGHDLGDFTYNDDATCTQDGTETAICNKCGNAVTGTVENTALGHAFGDYVSNNDATCTQDGTETAICSQCGDAVTRTVENTALGHAFGDYASNNDATCTQDGTMTATCERCEETATEVEVGSAYGHNYESTVTAPTCETGGYTVYTCVQCGDEYIDDHADPLGHSYGYAVEQEPTAEQAGLLVGTCASCEATFQVEMPCLNEEDYIYAVDQAPTCTADGVAGYLWKNASYGIYRVEVVLPSLGHSYSYAVEQEPTAEQAGLLVATCAFCEDAFQVEMPCLNEEDYIYAVDQAPTCTADGVAGYLWKNAKYGIYRVEVVLPSLGHSYSYAVEQEPTAEQAGLLVATCVSCEDAFQVEMPSLNQEDYLYAVDQAPTCTAEGAAGYLWKNAKYGIYRVEVVLPSLGHSYSYAVEQEPTVEEVGLLVGTCASCEDAFQVELPILTEEDYLFGIKAFPSCAVDGALSYTWNNTDYGTYSFDVILPSSGHSYGSSVTDPTCTEVGYTTYTCHCGDTYTADEVAALGHSFDNGICTVCGAADPGEETPVVQPVLTLKAPSLEFKDTITVNAFFTAENTEDVVEMGMITYGSKVDTVSVETADHVIPGASYNEGTGRYVSSSQGIHAKNLCDTVYLACYAKLTDGSYVYTKLASYSPVQYAESQLKNSSDVKLKQLVVAMLNYGAQAQLFFGHNTENLANASLTGEQMALPESYRADMVGTVPAASAEKQGDFANNGGFAKRYPAVSFEGALSINYFFTPNYAPVDGITLYYWNEADFTAADVLAVENASGSVKMEGSSEYRGDVLGISAKDLSEAVYVAAVYSDGTTTWTSGVLGYSIGAYCASQSAKGTTAAALAEATAVYGYHAKAYFG